MLKRKLVFVAALPALLLASCGSQEAATSENLAVAAEANGLDNASLSDPGQPNGSEDPGVDSGPPPDAVSHPEGYLPNAGDVPPPAGPEPTADSPTGSKAPPATEDDYIRNRQAGG